MVTEIANSAESNLTADQVTNFKVKVRILESSYKDLIEGKPEAFSPFRPGMTATVDIITNSVKDAIAVPISAIVIKTDTTTSSFGDNQYEAVFVKNGDKAMVKRIKTGIQDDTNIIVTTGLEIGDEVITGPYNTVTKLLKEGDLVEVKKDAKFGASQED